MPRKKLSEFLDFSRSDLSKATGVPQSSIRDDRMPQNVKDRLLEIAHVCELVAGFFEGDVKKTAQWFKLPNPMLGYISPRDMLRYGRYKKLLAFIMDALSENKATNG